VQGLNVGHSVIHDLTPWSDTLQRKEILENADIALIASEIAKLQTPVHAIFAVLLHCSEEKAQPVIMQHCSYMLPRSLLVRAA
jgi:hypothetical protein